jgi:hypothetical protein
MAADIVTPAMKWFFDLGFGNVFVFILVAAIFYAMMRKSKIFGGSEVVNGAVALVASFFVAFWIPIYTGFSFISSMSAFFAQSTVFLLFLVISFLMASFFYPDLMGMLSSQFKSRHTMYLMMALGIGILVMSTLITSIWQVFPPSRPGSTPPPTNILIISAAVIIFIIIIIIGASIGAGGH